MIEMFAGSREFYVLAILTSISTAVGCRLFFLQKPSFDPACYPTGLSRETLELKKMYLLEFKKHHNLAEVLESSPSFFEHLVISQTQQHTYRYVQVAHHHDHQLQLPSFIIKQNEQSQY